MVLRVLALHLVDGADLQMILQIGAHRQIASDLDAVALQELARTYARELQNLRRVDGAGAQQYLALGMDGDHLAAGPDLGPGAALAATRQILQQQAADLGVGPHLEIGAAIAGGAQKALAVFQRHPPLIDLEIAHTLVVSAVEVIGGGDAGLLCGLSKSVQNVPAQALTFHAPLTAAANALVAVQAAEFLADLGQLIGIQPPVVFMLAKRGQHLVPAPGIVSRQLGPLLIVAGLTAHVDHAVDAGAAAQGLAARIAQAAAVEAGVGLGLIEPVGARIAYAVEVADGNVNPVVVVLATGLDEQHPVVLLRDRRLHSKEPAVPPPMTM